MKRHRLSAVIAAGATAAALLTIAPAGAQAEPVLDVTPTSGPLGTVIHVAGDQCDTPVVALANLTTSSSIVTDPPDVDTTTHTWSLKIRVETDPDDPIEPGHVLRIRPHCLDIDEPLFFYKSVEFLVTEDDTPTTPTTAPPAPTTPLPTTPRPPTPIVGDPPFTG